MEDRKRVTFWPGNPLSYTTTKISCFFNEVQVAVGTGYMHRFAKSVALVTNWHLLTGRNPIDDSVLDRVNAAIPNRIKFHVAVTVEKTDGVETVHFREIDLRLYDERDEPIWKDAKSPKNQRDVALILLDEYVPELMGDHLSVRAVAGGVVTLAPGVKHSEGSKKVRFEELRHPPPPVGSEVFVLGYPRGVSSSGVFPIWKRASIASEPQVAIELSGQQYDDAFYIDAMTRDGMSGSPVIYFQKPGDYLFTDDGVRVKCNKHEPLLIGVYAGRNGVSQEEYELSVGRVWKVSLVESLFSP